MRQCDFAREFQGIYRRLWLVAASVTGDTTEADDIVQEAAIVAFQKRDEFREGTNFAAWVTAIVRRCAANHRRKSAGRRTFAADPTSLDQRVDRDPTTNTLEIAGNPEALPDTQREFDDVMFDALNQLSAQARCCLLLRVVDGMSYRDIAEHLGIPEGTAMSHVHRSKKIMRLRVINAQEKADR